MSMRRAMFVVVVLTLIVGGFLFGRLTGGDQVALNVNAVKRVFVPLPAPPKPGEGPAMTEGEVSDVPKLIMEVPGEGAAVGASFEVAGRIVDTYDRVSVVVHDASGAAIFSDQVTVSPAAGGGYGRFDCTVNLLALPADAGVVKVTPYAADGTAGTIMTRSVVFAAAGTVGIKTYFLPVDVGNDCTNLTAVERRVSDSGQVYRLALEQLLVGPTEAEKARGLTSALPTDAKLRSVAADGEGVVTADFYQSLERGVAGSCRVAALRAQISETLRQFPEVHNVIISVNGRTEDVLQP